MSVSHGCRNVVLPFFHTVSFILISPSPDMTNFIRVLTGNVIVNVFKSDAVIWWAAIFRRGGGQGGRWFACCSRLKVVRAETRYSEGMHGVFERLSGLALPPWTPAERSVSQWVSQRGRQKTTGTKRLLRSARS